MDDTVAHPLSTVGKTIIGILEGGVDPQGFIPRTIDLWGTAGASRLIV